VGFAEIYRGTSGMSGDLGAHPCWATMVRPAEWRYDRARRGRRNAMPKQDRRDRRTQRDLHVIDEDGMVACNPRDREAAHRAEVEGIATSNHAAVTCRKCLAILHRRSV